jgi:hypothetical protein
MYEGFGGVLSSGVQFGSATVSGLPVWSASRMAVIGRHRLYVYLASKWPMTASDSATFSSAKSRAFWSSVLPRDAAALSAISFQ